MSKIKRLLDVVEDMDDLAQCLKAAADKFCHLAGSIKTVAQAIRDGDSKTASLPAPKVADSPGPKQKPLAIEEVRDVLRPRIKAADRDAVQDILRKYGSHLLTEIDPVHYNAIVADAKELISDEELEAFQKKGKVN